MNPTEIPVLQIPSNNVLDPAKRNPRGRKVRKPVMFCRPGIVQPDSRMITQELELAIRMAQLNLDTGVYLRFEDMDLNADLLKGIYNYGHEVPAFIQQRAIVPCIQGKDAIIQAQSGMGKTGALVISVLQRLDVNNPKCQAIVLAPTRELAEQIQDVFDQYSKFMAKVSSFSCVGGRPVRTCKSALLSGRQVVIGTVGRTAHMMVGDGNGTYLNIDSVKILALDEADQMFNGGYGRDLTTILERIPSKAQIILMSATMPNPTLKLTKRFMVDPVMFLLKNFELTLDGIQQFFIQVEEDQKLATLADIYPSIAKTRGMIFCNTRTTVTNVMDWMRSANHNLACIHGDMTQGQRDIVMGNFRMGTEGFRMILTSDLLGRGIDIQQVNLVLNYDLPVNNEEYIHRVGRAGRYGRKGVALTLITEKQKDQFRKLEEFYNTQIQPMPTKPEFARVLLGA